MRKYLVGGAVRDTYLKRPVSDQDYVVVGATPQEMLDLGFEQVGEAFPVFLHPETGEEYALARIERKTGAGHTGFETVFDSSVTLADDLYRRDLTINAMAIDMETADLIDPYGGLKDLKAKVLRHVGPAFSEDPLRVVRLARFKARFTEDGFTVHPDTMALARQLVVSGELNELSAERFAAEVVKVLHTCTPKGCKVFFDMLDELDFSRHVTFFRGVDLPQAGTFAKALCLGVAREVQPALIAAMIYTDEARAEKLGGSLAVKLQSLLHMMRTRTVTVQLVYDVLRASGAWTEDGGHLPVLLSALQILAFTGNRQSLSSVELLAAATVTSPCGSLGAQLAAAGVKGAAIGEAILAARLTALRSLNLFPG